MFTAFLEVVYWGSLGLIMYTYAGYPLLVRWMARWAAPRRSVGSARPIVSVVVAAYNEQAVIADKIDNCLALEYPSSQIEFLFGSDGSDDGTDAMLARPPDPRIRFQRFERRGKAATLNDLVPLARGEVLVFSDANSLFEPDAILQLVQHFSDASVGGVCGKLILHTADGAPAPESLYWRLESAIKADEGRLGVLASANGAIYAIRRDLFRPLPTGRRIADDLVIGAGVLNQGRRMLFEPAAIAREQTSPHPGLELQRKIRVGEIAYNAIPELLPLLHPRRGLVAWSLWSHKILRWAVPLLLIAVFVANTLLLGPLWAWLSWLAQVSLYLTAAVGHGLAGQAGRLPWLMVPYYFVGANLALLIGLYRALTQRGGGAWARTGR